MQKDFIQSIKEFFFDIIGFLIPGTIVLILSQFLFEFTLTIHSYPITISAFGAYAIGYLVFSLTQIKDHIFRKLPTCLHINTQQKILKDLCKDSLFKVASYKIKNEINFRKEYGEDFNG